ncbi:16675_t:CDS:2 [Acaulospora colombiana]|uniref:16675_t:CDS:1 n=1 Tax=Acaulospora colombiana TaxID=27376 RepID=A0ACA9MBR2_9GLOM|nr:16675_t:CDS:2 [Acaulospora colombiana]
MAPAMYRLVRLLFKISANAFYEIEVDGTENIPPDGCPTLICPNHSNSLTDPICLLSSIPKKKRDMTLTRNKDREDFSINLLTVSIVYIHREKFRSNVLVKFNPPIVLTPKHHSLLKNITSDEQRKTSEDAIRELTSAMEQMVRSNTLDAPSWQTLRIAHTARKLYAGDLGTRISLAEYVRLTKKFIDALSKVEAENSVVSNDNEEANVEEKEIIVERIDAGNLLHVRGDPGHKNEDRPSVDLDSLTKDLAAYQNLLDSYGIKDYRFSRSTQLSKPELGIREEIKSRVQELAVNELGLPENPESFITKTRPRGMGYFSIKRRRKKDYNEVLRLWDVSAYD